MGGQATPGAQRPIGFWLKLVVRHASRLSAAAQH